MERVNFVENLVQDVRYAVRALRKKPALTIVAVVSIALGISSTTVIFGVVYSLVFKPFPYKNFNQSIVFAIQAMTQDQPVTSRNWFYISEFETFRDQNRVFQDIAGYYLESVLYDDGSGMRDIRGAFVTTNTFNFLGVLPFLGRGLTLDDERADGPPVFVMNYRFWKGEFNSDPNILGKSFVLNGKQRMLVGIMPPRFQFADGGDIWLPLSLQHGAEGHFIAANLPVGLQPIARLKPGVPMEAARADLNVIAQALAKLPVGSNHIPYPERFSVITVPLRDSIIGNVTAPLYALLAAVVMLLLIACSNVANLLLSRATAREREIAVRASLGASRARLILQLLIETFVLAALACVLSCVLAYFGLRVIIAVVPTGVLPSEVTVTPDPTIFLFALCVSLLTTILCGLAPGLHVVGADLRSRLASGTGSSGTFRHGRLRAALVIAETAISIVLLIGAGLMIRTFFALTHVDLGFNTQKLVYARITLPKSRLPEQKKIFFRELLERLKALPGVTSASEIAQIPTLGAAFPNDLTVLGQSHSDRLNGMFDFCSEGFSQTLGLRLVRGRLFSQSEVESARLVAVINQTLARQYFPKEDPIGKKINFHSLNFMPDAPRDAYFEIVGIVADFQNVGLRDRLIPEAFLPYTITGAGPRSILIRTVVDPKSFRGGLSRQISAVDSEASLREGGAFEDLLATENSVARFQLIMLNAFAGVGLLLAILGVFSVMAHTVSLQTHEIGIRMALGAQQADISRMVLRKGLRLITAGITIGLVASFWLTRFIARQVWGVSATDLWTFGSVVIVILVVGLAASWSPAQRAMRVDPLVALRYE
jgi:predicted permease